MFRVVWKNAQKHQNTFLTTPDSKKYLFQGHVSGGLAQMHQNTFSTTPDVKIKIFFPGGSNRIKITFLTTPDGKKYLFQGHVSGGLEPCENASKHVFNRSRR
jgi:hypothetical protein